MSVRYVPSRKARRIARDWYALTGNDLVWLRRELGMDHPPEVGGVREPRRPKPRSPLQAGAIPEDAQATKGTGI